MDGLTRPSPLPVRSPRFTGFWPDVALGIIEAIWALVALHGWRSLR
jgi:hypothetical protein